MIFLILQILPFECIRVLGRKFRADVSADQGCPRMCKRKFVCGGNKGFSLDELNEALGDTKDIVSVLEATDQERGLLRCNVEDYVDDCLGYVDPVVETWNDRLLVKRKKIFWKSLYEKDVRARGSSSGLPSSNTLMIEDGNEKEKPVENLETLKAELLNALDKGIEKCLEAIGELDKKVVKQLGDLELRVKVIQNYVANGLRAEGGTPRSGFVMFNSPSIVTPVGEMDMDEQENVAALEKEKELAEAVGKRKNEKESVGEDLEKKKRLKVEKVMKSLGDVELVATGTKRNRE